MRIPTSTIPVALAIVKSIIADPFSYSRDKVADSGKNIERVAAVLGTYFRDRKHAKILSPGSIGFMAIPDMIAQIVNGRHTESNRIYES